MLLVCIEFLAFIVVAVGEGIPKYTQAVMINTLIRGVSTDRLIHVVDSTPPPLYYGWDSDGGTMQSGVWGEGGLLRRGGIVFFIYRIFGLDKFVFRD